MLWEMTMILQPRSMTPSEYLSIPPGVSLTFYPSGNAIVIHTFNYYVQNAITSLQAKGAIPIISSQTPNNGWTDGSISAGPRFVGYAELAGERTGATYIDHYAYVAQAYNALGETTVNTYYPNDHTHTSPEGAEVVAEAFVRGLLCSDNDLKNHVNSAGQGVPSKSATK
jgi:rhamnogalacturonan acetylesterase